MSADRVMLDDGVPPSRVSAVLSGAHVLVNAMRSGSGDKVVFEAMAAGRPVVVSNPCFRELLAGAEPDPFFPPDDSRALAERIRALGSLDAEELARLGVSLRERVVRSHSLGGWADAVVGEFGRRGRAPLP